MLIDIEQDEKSNEDPCDQQLDSNQILKLKLNSMMPIEFNYLRIMSRKNNSRKSKAQSVIYQ